MKNNELTLENVKKYLKQLNLNGISSRLEEIIDFCTKSKLTPIEILAYILKLEVEKRANNRLKIGLNVAHFPMIRTLEDFNFSIQPSIDEQKIRELAKLEWIKEKRNLLLLGPSGVGKTHLAIALGRKAIEAGMSTLFISAYKLSNQLDDAVLHGLIEEKLKQYTKPKLLIIDELGYLNLKQGTANNFFHLISRRYEKSSILITSNSQIIEWGKIFSDIQVTTAMIDRLLHHGEVIKILGDSYRLADMRKNNQINDRNTNI